jgi:hypothetical protein
MTISRKMRRGLGPALAAMALAVGLSMGGGAAEAAGSIPLVSEFAGVCVSNHADPVKTVIAAGKAGWNNTDGDQVASEKGVLYEKASGGVALRLHLIEKRESGVRGMSRYRICSAIDLGAAPASLTDLKAQLVSYFGREPTDDTDKATFTWVWQDTPQGRRFILFDAAGNYAGLTPGLPVMSLSVDGSDAPPLLFFQEEVVVGENT